MFSVIYKFKVKEGQEEVFEKAWQVFTKFIYNYEGSLGSRLHKNASGDYIAYAQWPDRDTWSNSGSKLPPESQLASKEMKGACHKMTVEHELHVVDDLLKVKQKA